jgi:hypothetical protein
MSAQLNTTQNQSDRFSQFKEKCRKEGAAMQLANTKKMENTVIEKEEPVLLDLYIPKMSLKTTEENIKDVLFQKNIGVVDYCDLVVVKHKETKEPQHMSAFLKLISWNPFSEARNDFNKNGSITVYLTPMSKEYWKIYPNSNPIPRTHVNISQLAASTEKLFEQQEKTDNDQKEMKEQMVIMKELIVLQKEKIDWLENKMENMFNQFVEMIQKKSNSLETQSIPIHRTFSYDQSELGPRLSLSDLDSDSNSESNLKSTLKPIQLPHNLDDDDCVFVKSVPTSIPRLSSVENVVSSLVIDLSNEENRTVSPENSVRASISRDFCGNH